MIYEKETHAGWLELFYDLVFAAAIAQLGQNLSHAVTKFGFLNYVTLFIIVVWEWIGATFYATMFVIDDLVLIILVILQMGGAVALAVNMHDAMDKTSIGFALSYVTIKFFNNGLSKNRIQNCRNFFSYKGIYHRFFFYCYVMVNIKICSFIISIYSLDVCTLIIDIEITVVITRKHFDLSPNKFHLPGRFVLTDASIY
jgi:low temperature requirement protein LtrA